MIYCFTGNGKGKTSAALGVVVRSLLIGKRVLWVSWYKSETWDISEKKLIEKFPDLLRMIWSGKGFYFGDKTITPPNPPLNLRGGRGSYRQVGKVKVYDFDTPEGHKKAAEEALGITKSTGGGYDLIVMDEVLNAVSDGLLIERELMAVLELLKRKHMVLTGRGATDEMVKICDLVTEVKKVKHPFDKGLLAVKGLDF